MMMNKMENIKWVLNKDVNILGGGNGTSKSFLFKNIYKNYKEYEHNLDGRCYIHCVYVLSDCISTIACGLDINDKPLKIEYINTFDCDLPTIEELNNIKSNRKQKIKTHLDFELNKMLEHYFDYVYDLGCYYDNPDYSDVEQRKIFNGLKCFEKIISKCFGETNKELCGNGEIHLFKLGDEEISMFDLSSGEKALLLILSKALLLDNKRSIMILDNPENGLHIDWQRELIGWIREINPNVQLIISTHSPVIIMNGWLDRVTNIEDLPTANFMSIS